MTETRMLAGRFRRLLATSIDAVLVPSLSLLLVMITGTVEDAEDYADSWWVLHVFLLAVVSYLILNGYSLWKSGQTLGKKIMGIAIVTSASFNTASGALETAPLWKLICIRALFFPLMFAIVVPPITLLPLIDHLMIFFKHRRCLHDLAAGTTVVRV